MKIKIFQDADVQYLEKCVNNWLDENKDIEIKSITQSESISADGTYTLTITMLYI